MTELTTGILTKEQIQQSVLETMLVLLNQARFAFLRSGGDAAMWALVSRKDLDPIDDYANPDVGPADLGLTFGDVADIEFVQTVMQMYDYGVLGIEDVSAPSLDDDEGAAAWASRTLYDLARSRFLLEWVEYAGHHYDDAVKRCLDIAEMANARLLLEGAAEAFFLEDRNTGLLTFRQLSLLSGVTEASLRTLVSRGAGPQTIKHGSATYIEINQAKEWLKARGRYTPIRRVSDRGAGLSTERRFASVDQLQDAIQDRAEYLAGELGNEVVAQRLKATGVDWLKDRLSDGQFMVTVSEAQLLDRELMKRLGAALELPAEVFALRAAETMLTDRLRRVEHELKGAKA